MRRSNAGGFPPGRSMDPFQGFGFGNNMTQSMFSDSPFANDPFFTDPFANFPSLFGTQSMFGMPGNTMGGNSIFGGSQFPQLQQRISQQQQQIQDSNQRGSRSQPIVVEVDDEHRDQGRLNRRGRRTAEPIVEHPDDEDTHRNSEEEQEQQTYGREIMNRPSMFGMMSSDMGRGGSSFSFQSSSVTISGFGGVKSYSASGVRRQGPDGIMEEQWQEEDSSGRKHMSVKRALGDKGRHLSRSRTSDGQDHNLERLYNLQPEEASDFDRTWQERARDSLPHYRNSDVTANQGTGKSEDLREGVAVQELGGPDLPFQPPLETSHREGDGSTTLHKVWVTLKNSAKQLPNLICNLGRPR